MTDGLFTLPATRVFTLGTVVTDRAGVTGVVVRVFTDGWLTVKWLDRASDSRHFTLIRATEVTL